jgi:molybdopterin synthase catalytic subunit
MRVRVLGFATAGDALGRAEVEIELDDGSRVEDLRRRLEGAYPGLAPIWPRLAVAVDGRLTAADAPLADGAEVALLPPVSGGSGRCRAAAGTARQERTRARSGPSEGRPPRAGRAGAERA